MEIEEQSYMSACRIVRQCRTLTWYLRVVPVDPIRAHFSAHRCIICRCFSSSDSRQIVESCWYSQERIQQRTGGRLSTFPNHGDSYRTTGGGRNRGRDSLRSGGLLLAPKSTLSRLKIFLVRRARVRDDSGRSPQIELDLERSF